MDLSRAPNERKLYLCKWYFKGMWKRCETHGPSSPATDYSPFPGTLYRFQPDSRCCPSCGPSTRSGSSTKRSANQPTKSRRRLKNVTPVSEDHENRIKPSLPSIPDVIFSLVGTLVWVVAIISWVVTFQLKRTDWGEFADNISFIIPLGQA